MVLGGFGVDGGLNGPGEPANSWKVGEALARVPASGVGADLWDRLDDLFHLLDALRPDHVVIPVDWARLAPTLDALDAATVAHYRALLTELRHRSIAVEIRLSDGCTPAALGQEFWLLPGSPEQFAAFVTKVATALGDLVERWETVHDPVRWVVEGYLCGSHPPFRRLAIDDACSALDNLLAAKKMVPMVVVMPNGSMPRPANAPPASVPPAPGAQNQAQELFANELLNDVMPFVEGNYRVRNDRNSRAIAGLSMGGGQTLRVAPDNLDKFAWVGVWSMGVRGEAGDFIKSHAAFFADPDKTNKQVKLLSVSVGAKDPLVHDASMNLVEILKTNKIKFEFHESEGAHTWINWRHYLNDYAQQLFR